MRPTTQAQTFLVAGHDECAGLQRQWRWEGEYSVSQFFYFTVYPSCSSGIRKTHLYGHFSHCLALVLTVSRTSNIRWLRNTKHPYLRKIRTLAGGQTKGGFGAWVKSESETEEKHEMLQRLEGLLSLRALSAKTSSRATSMLPKKVRKNDCELMYTAPHYSLSFSIVLMVSFSIHVFISLKYLNRLFVSITKPPSPTPHPATSTVRYRVGGRNYWHVRLIFSYCGESV